MAGGVLRRLYKALYRSLYQHRLPPTVAEASSRKKCSSKSQSTFGTMAGLSHSRRSIGAWHVLKIKLAGGSCGAN